MSRDPEMLFTAGLAELGMVLPVPTQQSCWTYLELLRRWNQHFNLTAITALDQMVTHHLLDSLAIAPWVKGPKCLDLGTGAGLPGVPLALSLPQTQWTLLDARAKKIRFLQQVAATLGISSMEVVHSRIEAFAPPHAFDTIVARAVADVKTLLKWTRHLLEPSGQLLLMTGQAQGLPASLDGFALSEHALAVPALAAARHVLCLRKTEG